MLAPHLDEIARLLGEATPGPWKSGSGHLGGINDSDGEMVFCGGWDSDVAFVVALVNAAPELLRLAREGERLEERVRVLEGALRPFAEHGAALRSCGADWRVHFDAAARALAATGEEPLEELAAKP